MTVGSTIKDSTTGVTFPLEQTFWEGTKCRSLGVGPRVKKVAMLKVKVYGITLYVDESAAKAGLPQAGSEVAVCEALTTGAYTKAFQMQVVRTITGAQFAEAFDEMLKPKLTDTAALESFKAFFNVPNVEEGSNVVMLWRQPDTVDLLLCPPGAPIADMSQASAGASISSAALANALWGTFLDASTPVPEARKAWIEGAKALAFS